MQWQRSVVNLRLLWPVDDAYVAGTCVDHVGAARVGAKRTLGPEFYPRDEALCQPEENQRTQKYPESKGRTNPRQYERECQAHFVTLRANGMWSISVLRGLWPMYIV